MTPTCLDRPCRLSCLFFLSAVILSTLSPCQFLCVTVWIAAIVHVSTHHFYLCIFYILCVRMHGSKSACVCVFVCVWCLFPASLMVSLEKQTPAITFSTAAGTHLHQNNTTGAHFRTHVCIRTLSHKHTSLETQRHIHTVY